MRSETTSPLGELDMVDPKPIDVQSPDFGEFYDELPLWSARFGLWLLDSVAPRAGQTILDVGTGTGFLSIELSQRCYPSRLIAVDPWSAAVIRLRKKVEFLGLNNIEILECDAVSLPLPDESVDLIVSNLGINNFDNAADVLANCWRIAKPGARIVMTSNLVGTMHEFYDVFRETLIQANATDRLSRLDEHIRHRATPQTLESQLIRAGFRVIRCETESFRIQFASGNAMLRHTLMRIGFIPAWKAIMAPDENDRLFSLLEASLNKRAKQHGELSLTIPMGLIEGEKFLSS